MQAHDKPASLSCPLVNLSFLLYLLGVAFMQSGKRFANSTSTVLLNTLCIQKTFYSFLLGGVMPSLLCLAVAPAAANAIF